uniref:Reverse transcriptase domain-containing protein n=1 Tax=Tanacetum cinerariifolium TaxID=118510 RepID=A0A6L2LFT6_TANCI|nr:hypothetical protein [Tanacetum cinerariifolium]
MCQQCGVSLLNGICLNFTYGDGKPVTCCECEGPLNDRICSFCNSRAGNSFAYDPNSNSFDGSQNLSDYPPQPQYQTYSCELCGNDAYYGYDCPPQYPVIHHSPQETSVEILQAKENLMKSIQTFLKKFNRIYFTKTPKVLSLAWEKFLEIQHPQPEDIHELLRKLLEDLQIISEELAEYINSPSWNYPTFYDDDDDEYSIQYREYLKNSNDDYFEDIDYIEASPLDSELVSLKESPSLFHIPVEDSDSFFENSDTFLSYSDNSLPEFDTFSDHTKETSSGSTTTHADNSLPEYDLFCFKIEPDQGELTSVFMKDILGEPYVHVPNVLPTHPTLMLDSNFIPSDDSLGSDLESRFSIHSDKSVNNGMVTDVRSMSEDYRLVAEINRAEREVNSVVILKGQFLEDLDSLGVRHVPLKMAEFLREIALCDTVTDIIDERENFVQELHVLANMFVSGKMGEFMKDSLGKAKRYLLLLWGTFRDPFAIDFSCRDVTIILLPLHKSTDRLTLRSSIIGDPTFKWSSWGGNPGKRAPAVGVFNVVSSYIESMSSEIPVASLLTQYSGGILIQ